MKTLVIHPKDRTTDFLSDTYAGRGWTVITDPQVSKAELKRQIKAHDRIILMGHGSDWGLLCMNPKGNGIRIMIGSDWVYALRNKDVTCIWCNADKFVNKYKLKGFYTGMIVSEMEEAIMYSLPFYDNTINESNTLFAGALKSALYQTDPSMMLDIMKSMYYDDENPIVFFNSQNLYVNVN